MPRLYTCEFEGVTIANASGDYELFEFDAATDKPIELRELYIYVTSELQEAQEEWLRLQIVRGHATDGTGGTSKTPRPHSPHDAAAGFTCDTARTAIATGGTAVNLHSMGMNVRAGFELAKAPLEGYWTTASVGDLLVVRLVAAVADDVTMSGTAVVAEYP